MPEHFIEPGQRLKMQSKDLSGFVQVIAKAIVPADYWICREEGSGQQRVIARTALVPIAVDPIAVDVEGAAIPA